ncbi:MAG: hypothetical protein QOI48_2762 [Solirubrobacteraceae bacterium]|jgi:hypothetical protein|nr:hypothetical protein [Solirubrobacteraceae bacterium]
MSRRQEEKERRKLERIERERAEAAAAKRKRLLMTAAGALVAVVAVVAIVLAVSSGKNDTSGGPSDVNGVPSVAIPARKITNLQEAAKAAGCAVREFPEEGREHIPDNQSFNGYKTNPPTSGTHHQTPAQDGIYTAGTEPAKESWVHTLEHGRIILQYKPGTPKRVIGQLQTLFNEKVKGGPAGYHMVLLQNNTKMPYQVAAVAWRAYIGCNEVNDKTWDALRAFRDTYVDKGPEAVP